MSGLRRVSHSSIAVIGAGAAGTLTAARLIDEAGRQHVTLRVTMVDPRPEPGAGVAYSTTDDRHLLNVPVRKMSAYPEDGEHFARWLMAQDGEVPEPCAFVPRGRYADYLRSVLADARRRAPMVAVDYRRDRAIGVTDVDGRCQLELESGAELVVDAVVLAVGNLGPEVSWAPDSLASSSRFVPDPWAPGALDEIPSNGDVLLVGTGLTMVDAVRVLDRPGRVIHAISRRGVVPQRHTPGFPPVMEAPEFPNPTPTLAELQQIMGDHIDKSIERYADWRPAIDSVRALTQRLWSGLSEADRADFVALDSRQWDALRHRIPPASADVISAARSERRLQIRAARVLDVVETDDGLDVSLSDGTRVTVAAVVNCAGCCSDPTQVADPLLQSLLASGAARSGPLGMGFATASDGQLQPAAVQAPLPIWTLGSLRRGDLWETTAIPEIRTQAAELARRLLGPDTSWPTDQDLKAWLAS